LQGAFAPAAHDLELNPQTPAGALPKVWIGAATGVAF
jgi:hypothetical protein